MKHISFITSWLHWIHLFHSFPFSCLALILGGNEMVHVELPQYGYHFLQCCYRTSALSLSLVLYNFCFLVTTVVPQVAEMSSVHCGTAPPASVRTPVTEGRHFSTFTVLGVLPSTAHASVVPQHGSVHLGIGDFFFNGYSRSTMFC